MVVINLLRTSCGISVSVGMHSQTVTVTMHLLLPVKTHQQEIFNLSRICNLSSATADCDFLIFYRAMHVVQSAVLPSYVLCLCLSVCPSVRDVDDLWSLGYFESNYTDN